jgi:hypothetical protein
MTDFWGPIDKELKEQVDMELEIRAHTDRLIDQLRGQVAALTDELNYWKNKYSTYEGSVGINKNDG